MGTTHFLTSDEKETGFFYLLKHSIWNGLGYSFLTETVIYLMAINFDATNVQLGYISSTLVLSGLILLIVPHLFGGLGLKEIFVNTWFLRGFVCLAYLALFFLKGQPAVWLIMITYTFFCIFRTLGVAANQPIVKNLMSSSSEGSRLLQLNSIGNRSALISRTISFIFLSLSFLSGIQGLIILTLLGVIVNTISSLYILKIPSRERVEKSRHTKGIMSLLVQYLRDRNTRRHLVILWLFMSVSVLNGFLIPFLQRDGHIPSNFVFLFSMLTVVGGLISNYFIKPYIDKTGSKPLLMLVSLILGLLFVLWSLIPPSAGLILFLPLGILHSFFMNLGYNLTNRLLYKIMPENKNRLGFSSMNSFIGAILALITGLSAGKIADSIRIESTLLPHTYSLVFLIAGVLTLLIALCTFFLSDQGSITVKEASELIFYTRNRRAFLWTYQLTTTDDPQKREASLLALEKSSSNLATQEMENQLNSPYSWEKERIFRSLYHYPRPELAELVRKEASDIHSYNRGDALFALARIPGEETEQVLLKALDDRDPRITSTALKSLCRLDREKYAPLTDEIYPRISHSSQALCDWFIACCESDSAGHHLRNIFSLASPEKGYRFQQLLFCLAARYYGREILLAPYYQQSNARKGDGLASFLEEMRDQSLFHDNEKKIEEWFHGGDRSRLADLMKNSLPYPPGEKPVRYLREAVDGLTPELMNRSSFLALLYFSYQIIRFSRSEDEEES